MLIYYTYKNKSFKKTFIRKSGKVYQLIPFDSKHEKMLILISNMRNGDENMAFSPLD